jgi:zinc transporter ZupT
MNAPRQIYVATLSRREASWGRSRRRPVWPLVALFALAVVGALIGPVILPALAS